jgi:hypothetical protein
MEAGFGIRRTDRNFELASVSRELIEKFSKRTMQIEELARRQYTVLSAKARALVKKTGMEFADAFGIAKAEVGAKSRKAKSEAKLHADAQLANWRAQMTPEERASLTVESLRLQNLMDTTLRMAEIGMDSFIPETETDARQKIVRLIREDVKPRLERLWQPVLRAYAQLKVSVS